MNIQIYDACPLAKSSKRLKNLYELREEADLYGCTGWVRNEWDGSVSMEIQGEEGQIDQVILAIERGTYVRIENMEVKSIPVVVHDYGFRTR